MVTPAALSAEHFFISSICSGAGFASDISAVVPACLISIVFIFFAIEKPMLKTVVNMNVIRIMARIVILFRILFLCIKRLLIFLVIA